MPMAGTRLERAALAAILNAVRAAKYRHERGLPSHPGEKLEVLVEEVGEVARAIADLRRATRDWEEDKDNFTLRAKVLEARYHVPEELAQVGAVVAMWLEQVNRKNQKDHPHVVPDLSDQLTEEDMPGGPDKVSGE